MFNELRKLNFWIGVVVVTIALRWVESMSPAIRRLTSPGGSA